MLSKSLLLTSCLCAAFIAPQVRAQSIEGFQPIGKPFSASEKQFIAKHAKHALHAADTQTAPDPLKPAADDDTSFRPAAPVSPADMTPTDVNAAGAGFSDGNTGRMNADPQTGISENGTHQGEDGRIVAGDGHAVAPSYNRDNEDTAAEAREVLRNIMPPEDLIREAKKQQAHIQRADADPAEAPYTPAVRTISVTLKPGELPPVIHLHYGVMTSLTFSSIRGTPWYVKEAFTDKSAYTNQGDGGDSSTKTNIVTLSPLKHFSQGRNLTVYLEHCAIPVILQLETGYSDKVDYRVDVSLQKAQPTDKPDLVAQGVTPMQDEDIQKFVNGTPPRGAKKLKSSNPALEAWRYGNRMFVRSEIPVMSPSGIDYSQGALSGVHVYKFKMTPNLIVSNDGELASVMIGN